MKNTLRTMGLVAAGLLGSVSMAQAQPPPPPPPPPAPPAAAPVPPPAPPAPPPVEFGVAPAALPPAPVGTSAPVPTVSWGATPGADTVTPAPEEYKPTNPFYFTRFTWGNTIATKIFGIGQSYQSPDEQYSMSFALNLRYYYVNKEFDKAWVNVAGAVNVELTDTYDTTTTTKREPVLNDLVIDTGYLRTVHRSADKQWKTAVGGTVGVTLPTSKVSFNQGKYLGAGINALAVQAIPLAGKKSDWFPDVLAFGIVGYSHLFSRCYYACNSDITAANPRTAPDGSSYASDLLSFKSFAPDKLKLNLVYYLSIYKDLSLANSWEVMMPFYHSASPTSVTTPTGGQTLAQGYTGSFNPTTTFDVSLSYLLYETVRIDVGYQNITPELSDNRGARNSVFYTPGGSAFYGNAVLYIDTLIDRKTAPQEKRKGVASNRFHGANF